MEYNRVRWDLKAWERSLCHKIPCDPVHVSWRIRKSFLVFRYGQRSGEDRQVSCTSSHGHMQRSLTLPALHSLCLQPWETGPIYQHWNTNWNEAQALAIKVIIVCIRPPRPLYALYKPGYVFVSSFPCFTPSLKNTWQRPECLQL